MLEKKIVYSVSNLPIEEVENDCCYRIEQHSPNEYTHNYFKYPCKFIPEIPRWAIKKYSNPNDFVFDPFAGSGTTVLEAKILGRNSFYTEIDEVAKLLISTKATQLTQEQQKKATEFLDTISIPANNAKEFIPQIKNLEHWFSNEVVSALSNIRAHIDSICDISLKNFLLVCLASIIKKVSNADSISPKPYVSAKVKKQIYNANDEYRSTVKKYLEGMNLFSQLELPSTCELASGDALSFVLPRKIKLAITSPPYINAFDYARTMRLENIWLGLQNEESLLLKKRDYVGTEQVKATYQIPFDSQASKLESLKLLVSEIKEKDKKRAVVVEKFFYDMEKNIKSVSESLEENGVYVIVIGNSVIRGVNIESWKYLMEIAKNYSLDFELHFEYLIQNPYIRIPRGEKSKAIKTDHILVLRKRG